MNLYLIVYGDDNEMATFQGDDADHAVEQFINWAPVSADPDENKAAVNTVYLCQEVELSPDADDDQDYDDQGNLKPGVDHNDDDA